jgi:hypothetical protein
MLCIGEMRNAYRIVVGNSERPRGRGADAEVVLQEQNKDVGWIQSRRVGSIGGIL